MDFSWKRAAKHVGIVVGAAIAICLALVFALDVKDPEKSGEGCGRLAGGLAVVTLGLSYLVQQGKKRLAGMLAAGLGVLVVGGITTAVLLANAHETTPLTESEKQPLTA